ncbi:MAG TPA: metallophosphoesterase family protein, partial [Armatimonadota bacterium]|nr:metallophosphoesterase family protein [Armatimonadota bacterium]
MIRRQLRIFILALLCIGLGCSLAHCMSFTVQPYLQQPAGTGMSILWVTSEAARGQIQVGRKADRLGKPIPAENVQPDICRVDLSRLKPGARYFYRVQSTTAAGETLSSDIRSFVTLNPRAKSTRAVFFNDLHSNLDAFKAVAGQCGNLDYSLAFFNGDCWQDPTKRETVLKVLSGYVEGIKPSTPLLFAHGNHEWRGPLSNQMWTLFAMPNLNGQSEWGNQHWYYSFTQGPVHFTILDCGEDDHKKMDLFQPYRQQEAEWLKQEVQSPEFRKAAFRVLVQHLPFYTRYNGVYNEEGEISAPTKELFEPILKDAGIDLAICAHTHRNQIFDPRDTANAGKFPYPLVIGGG